MSQLPPDEERDQAIRRLRAKREFYQHVTAYVIVNLGLIVVWALTGGDYFWPVWPILGWGIGLLFHGWSVYGEKPMTEEAIQREIERGRQRAGN
jgi:2TM domain